MCTILLATHSLNGPNGGICFFEPYTPPHCIGYEVGEIPRGYTIPCGRGGEDGHAKLRNFTVLVGNITILGISPLIIGASMITMYRSVSKVEKQMQNYGVGALRQKASLAVKANRYNSDDIQDSSGFICKMKRRVGNCMCLKGTSQTYKSKSNTMRSQKRAVLYMAFGYAGAWLFVWVPYLALVIDLRLSSDKFVFAFASKTSVLTVSSMTPLQGFFNFIVFMAPKVRHTRKMAIRRGKRRNISQHVTWREAFFEAYSSRRRGDNKGHIGGIFNV